MAKNFKQHGEALHYVVQASDNIKSGDLFAVNDVVGVAITDGVVGEEVAIHVQGVWEVPLPAALGDVPQGRRLFFNPATREVSLTATHIPIGHAWNAGTAGGTIHVALNR